MSIIKSRHQVHSIQALRGMAALAVVIAHCFEHGSLGGMSAVFMGRFGVEVFFVISGFVITLAAGNGAFSPGVFAIRRFFRVVPLYWGTTFLVAGLAFCLPAIFRTTVFDSGYFIRSLFFIPTPLPGTNDWRPLFKLGWTLNYELFFYLIIGLLFWCRTGLMRSICAIFIIILFIIISFFVEHRVSIFAFYANLNLMPFAAGIVISELSRQRTDFHSALAKFILVFISLSGAFVFWAMQYSHIEFFNFRGHFVLTCAAVCVVLAALASEKHFLRHAKFWIWLGNISYSLYLLHMLVVGVGWVVLKRVGGGIASPVTSLLGVAVMVGVSLAVASASYRLFEEPLARLTKRVSQKRYL